MKSSYSSYGSSNKRTVVFLRMGMGRSRRRLFFDRIQIPSNKKKNSRYYYDALHHNHNDGEDDGEDEKVNKLWGVCVCVCVWMWMIR